MADPARISPRFGSLAPGHGHYESFYLKAGHPSEPLAVWVRYTVHKAPDREATGSLWFTLFEPGGPRAVKTTLPAPGTPPGSHIRIGDSCLSPGSARGHAEGQGVRAAWDVAFESSVPPFFHLPKKWIYRSPVPRTKLLSPYPDASFRGSVEIDGRVIDLDGWRGMVGHNWGTEHAERWIWLHGMALRGDGVDRAWLDVALGRVRVGPLRTPWIAGGVLSLDGVRHRLGGPLKALKTEVRESPDRCEFSIPGRDLTVRGAVGADRADFVGWVYADPGGSEHHAVNCSIANLALTLSGAGLPERRLEGGASAVYELGMRERDHGIAIQPFPDP